MDEINDNESIISESSVSSNESNIPLLSFIETLNDDEIVEFTSTCFEMIDDYVEQNMLQMCDPHFYEQLVFEITNLFIDEWKDANIYNIDEDDDDEIYTWIESISNDYFDMLKEDFPLRSQKTDPQYSVLKKSIQKKMAHIRSIPQPEQRTPEWYKFRHELMTASNLWKLFGTESQYNSLIYEKCVPLKEDVPQYSGDVNILSPMHWGQKYEPLSIMLYEHKYKTKIEDFGCIQHDKYSFIGASPDGINVDPNNNKYGRMLEIKNIVNREIDGIPSKAYWIQMQLQMETCDLDDCDFLETRFKQYNNEEEFYQDETQNKGVIIHFIERISIGCGFGDPNATEDSSGYMLAQQTSGAPKYVYMPLDIPLVKETIEQWIEEQRMKLRRSWSIYSVDYWKLDEFSCVYVERNKKWFQQAAPIIEKAWNTILKERETGYEHRAAKKRIVKNNALEIIQGEQDNKIIKNLPMTGGICLVKLDKEDR